MNSTVRTDTGATEAEGFQAARGLMLFGLYGSVGSSQFVDTEAQNYRESWILMAQTIQRVFR